MRKGDVVSVQNDEFNIHCIIKYSIDAYPLEGSKGSVCIYIYRPIVAAVAGVASVAATVAGGP